ncbi:hypothetical protein AMTRI_Chr06g169780 [Amborella trichopoda]
MYYAEDFIITFRYMYYEEDFFIFIFIIFFFVSFECKFSWKFLIFPPFSPIFAYFYSPCLETGLCSICCRAKPIFLFFPLFKLLFVLACKFYARSSCRAYFMQFFSIFCQFFCPIFFFFLLKMESFTCIAYHANCSSSFEFFLWFFSKI